MTSHSINQKTIDAYKLYSKYYAFIALITYWVIWRGNLSRHIRFFRDSLAYDKIVLDIATGDGSLTKAALFAFGRAQAEQVVAVDISDDMLHKAKAKLKKRTSFLKADVEQLPFASDSQKLITCFGGLNSFASPTHALMELSRILARDGHIRGSFLLFPKATWKQKLVRGWIEQGYQTCEPSMPLFESWCGQAGLDITQIEQNGDVVLFELQKHS